VQSVYHAWVLVVLTLFPKRGDWGLYHCPRRKLRDVNGNRTCVKGEMPSESLYTGGVVQRWDVELERMGSDRRL
jgi:hypothetical protein